MEVTNNGGKINENTFLLDTNTYNVTKTKQMIKTEK